eukprot:Hpha_TRINITY_DN15055_c4_g3::TRINITY_DN15055_c4_g3_i1::g.126226::m.126226
METLSHRLFESLLREFVEGVALVSRHGKMHRGYVTLVGSVVDDTTRKVQQVPSLYQRAHRHGLEQLLRQVVRLETREGLILSRDGGLVGGEVQVPLLVTVQLQHKHLHIVVVRGQALGARWCEVRVHAHEASKFTLQNGHETCQVLVDMLGLQPLKAPPRRKKRPHLGGSLGRLLRNLLSLPQATKCIQLPRLHQSLFEEAEELLGGGYSVEGGVKGFIIALVVVRTLLKVPLSELRRLHSCEPSESLRSARRRARAGRKHFLWTLPCLSLALRTPLRSLRHSLQPSAKLLSLGRLASRRLDSNAHRCGGRRENFVLCFILPRDVNKVQKL